jgi:hypothetical protein
MEANRAPATSDSLSAAIRGVRNFEAIFQIPATHQLVLVRSRSQGCPISAVFWEHDEFDAQGRLVARYRSFEQVSASGERQRGWRRFDSHGQLVSEDNDLQYTPRVFAVISTRDGNSRWE